MSCWIVDTFNVKRLASYLFFQGGNIGVRHTLQSNGYNHELDFIRLTNKMLKLNHKSFNARYETTLEAPKVKDFDTDGEFASMQFLKSLQCYLYQSCEGRCDKTKLYKMLDRISKIIEWNIISEMPDYKEAKWE